MKENEVRVDLIADPSKLKPGFDEGARHVRDFEREVHKSGDAAKEAARHHDGLRGATAAVGVASVAAVAGVAALTGAYLKLSEQWVKNAEQLANIAEKTDMTVEELSLMRLGAETANSSLEKLALGTKNLSMKMLEANSGNREAQALFRALGVEWEDGTGKLRRTVEVMDDIATSFAGVDNGAGKSAVASKLLGRTVGEDLIPYLNQGGEKLRMLRNEADALGHKIDTETARAIKELKDDFKALELTAAAAAGELSGPFLKSLREVFAEMRAAAKEGLLSSLLAGARKGAQYAVGVGSEQQELDNALLQLQRRYATMADLQRRAEGGERNEGQRRGLQGEITYWEGERNRLSSVLAIGNPVGTSSADPSPPVPARRRTIDDVTKEERERQARDRGFQRGQDPDSHVRLMRDLQKQQTQGADDYRKAIIGPHVDLAQAVTQMDEETIYTWRFGERVAMTKQEYAEFTKEIEAAKPVFQDNKEMFEDLIRATEGLGKASSTAAATMLVDWKFSSDAVRGLLRQLAIDMNQMWIQRAIMNPLMNQAARGFPALFASQWDAGSGGANAPQGMGTGMYTGAETGTWLHDGGVVGVHGRRGYVNPAVFAGAPRMHRGGELRPDEVPIIGKVGEEMLTENDPRHRRNGGGVKVVVINQSSQPVDAEVGMPQFDPEGMVVNVVLRDLQTGGPIREQIERSRAGVS